MENEESDDKVISLEVLVLQSLSVFLQFISLGFNGAIIFTIWKKSLMRFPSSRFVFSLCLSHLLVSIISLTISGVSYFVPSQSFLQNVPLLEAGNDNENIYSCFEIGPAILNHTLLYITFGVSISTLLTVTLISVERYITIARPMKYKSIVTPRRCFASISLCWILSALFVIFPVVFFHKKTKQCGEFLIPIGNVGLYFAVIITLLTVLALSVMIICYSHIFTIAKSKCQKVQIGQFSASAPASISSDWPSSVYSGVQGNHQQITRGWFQPGARMISSNSLLHWVLMANLRQNSNPLRASNPPNSPDLSPTSSIKSEPDSLQRSPGSSSSKDPRLSRAKKKWRKYLQQNYNSPRKTVCTILFLIGSVIITQVPMSFILFTHLENNPVLFYFCHDLLFTISSVTNPILYGFLNRTIRDQLWKIFRPKTRRRNRQKRANSLSNNCTALRGELHDIFSSKTEKYGGGSGSRKGSLTSEESNSTNGSAAVSRMPSTSSGYGVENPNPIRRKDTAIIGLDELDRFKFRRKLNGLGILKEKLEFKEFIHPVLEPKCSTSSDYRGEGNERERKRERISRDEMQSLRNDDPVQEVDGNNEEQEQEHGIILDEEILQNLEFPRKPSQDSGADMSFSDEDLDDQEENASGNPVPNRFSLFNPSRRNSSIQLPSPQQALCKSCTLLDSKSNRIETTSSNFLVLSNANTLDIDRKKSKSKSDSDIINSGVRKNSLPPPPLYLQQQSQVNEIVIKSQCHLGFGLGLESSSGQEMNESSQLSLALKSVSVSSSRQNLIVADVKKGQEGYGYNSLNNLDVKIDNSITKGSGSFGHSSYNKSSNLITPSCSNCANYSTDDLLNYDSMSGSHDDLPLELPNSQKKEDINVEECDEDDECCDTDDSVVIAICKNVKRVSVSGNNGLPHNDSFCTSSSGTDSSTTESEEDDYEEDERVKDHIEI